MYFSDSRNSSAERSSMRAKGAPCPRGQALAVALGVLTVLTAGCASQLSTASARNAQGVESFSSGRYDDAITLFQESLESNPENAETYYNLASAYQRKAAESGDTVLLGQAEDAYWTALEHDPKPETIVCCYRGLATSAMARGDFNGALQTLEAWRDRNPDSIEPKLEIAYLMEAQQKDEQAYDILKEVAAEAPDDYRAYYKMGVLSERAGDLEDAIENANVAYKLNPTDSTVAQRVNSIEAQVAARQRKGEEAPEVETALAKAEFADPAATVETAAPQTTPVQTTPVQTTSAHAQENETAPQQPQPQPQQQPEMVLPTNGNEQPNGIPTSNLLRAPATKMQSLASEPATKSSENLGFGNAVAFGSNESTSSSATTSAETNRRKNDDSDVKWITSSNAERVRRQIAQTSATTPAATTGFNNVVSDGTGSASQKLPNKTVTTAQFVTPAFAAAQASPAAAASPNVQETSVPAAQTQAAPESVKPSEEDKPRAELNSGPPRLSAGSFF